MDLSHTIRGISGGTDGWEILYAARALIGDGVAVLNLTIGEHDVRTDPAILSALEASARGGHTGYAAVPGTRALRQEVAARVERMTGVPTAWENVLIVAGGQAGLFSAHRAVLDAGDRALHCDPFYATYPGTIRAVGGVPCAVMTRPETAFQPAADDLDRAMAAAPGAKSILVNTPNNPTGVVYSADTVARLSGFAQTHDLWLISDEVYDSQVWAGRHLSPRALPGMAERTFVIGSMSKSHAMTGSRIGWVIGPADAIAAMAELSVQTNYGVPGYIQDAALFALRQGPAFEAQIAAPFARRRARAMALLDGQANLRLIPSSGAMYLMVDIRATGMDGVTFARRLLAQERIAVMPGESFGAAAAGHIRIALTLPDADLMKALERIIAFSSELSADRVF